MVINWLDFMWFELTLKGISEQTFTCWTLADTVVQQSLAQFFNSNDDDDDDDDDDNDDDDDDDDNLF